MHEYNVDGVHDARQFILGHLQKISMMIFRNDERMTIMNGLTSRIAIAQSFSKRNSAGISFAMILQKMHAIVSPVLSGEGFGISPG